MEQKIEEIVSDFKYVTYCTCLIEGATWGTKDGERDSDKHLLTLFSLACSIKAKTIVELGAYQGNTTLPFLMASHLNDGTVHSVDLNQSPYVPPKYLEPKYKFYKQDALEFLKSWDRSKVIDLIFVDDLHQYEHVAKELDIIYNLVSGNSLVVMHDTMYFNSNPHYHSNRTITDNNNVWKGGGPYRAVEELDLNKWEYCTVPICHGLTILRKLPNPKIIAKALTPWGML